MATIKITYYGMDGEGPTVRAAKEDAGRKLETALREAKHGVHLIAFAGIAAVVAYDVWQSEWGYRLINTEPGKFHAGPQWVTCCGDRQASRLAALRHIFDIAWSPSVEDDDAFANDALAGRDHGCPITHTERATMKRDLMERWAW